MRVCIHRGSHQIGGSCVELACEGKRLLLDLGLPLDQEENKPELLPAIPALTQADDSLLGVVISHPHMDHFGLLRHVRPDLPIAMGEAGRRILEAAAPWMKHAVVPGAGPVLKDRECFQWGPFRITPYLVDHSAFDAYALLVEAGGKRLLYSGDFRAHGRTQWRFDRLLENPPQSVDLLMMEGTSLGRFDMDGTFKAESDLENEMVEAFKSTQGLALVCASAQNIDRMVTLFRAAMRSRRKLIIDTYTACILEATGNPHIPQSHWDEVSLYVPLKQRIQIKENKLFALLDRHKRHRIFPQKLASMAGGSVMLIRDMHRKDLEKAKALDGARLFYSQWEGYLNKDSGKRMQEWAEAQGVPMQVIHTSGHASPVDLKRFVHAINPGALVPIHSFEPGKYKEIFERTEGHEDGVWWEM